MGKTLAILALFLCAVPVFATDIYVAQSSAGGNTGADCADARAKSSLVTGDWAAGNTIHLCGAISPPVTALASGTMGSKITIEFEPGSSIAAAAIPTTGAIVLTNQSYIVVDGGGGSCGWTPLGGNIACSQGQILSTANGSGLANQVASIAIEASGSTGVEIRSLGIGPIYTHTSASDTIPSPPGPMCVDFSGAVSFSIHNNTMHDALWCLYGSYGTGAINANINNNEIYNVDHGVVSAGFGSFSASNFFVRSNHIHDFLNWDTAGGTYHHDGVHGYGTSGANLTNLQVYDNLFDGNPGVNFTSFIRFEKPDSSTSLTSPIAFNNILNGSSQPSNNFGLFSGDNLSGQQVYDNTFIGITGGSSYCMITNGGTSGFIENNVFSGCGNAIADYGGGLSGQTINYNAYSQNSCLGYIITGATCYSSLAAWQGHTGGDANSLSASNLNLNSNFQQLSGSAVIGRGLNLTSLGIADLNLDIFGSSRPSGVTAWDIGAYYGAGAVPSPNTGMVPVMIGELH